MKFLFSKRGIAAVVVLVLILSVFRPGIHALRGRISNSIGRAVGRRVTIENVRLHLLPRPGFDLEDLIVYDDPAFSPEPMIRAQDVFAAVRLRSLLRGRIEIAELSATEPSINIVRNTEGRWNFANLIERNARIPAAPTQKAPAERRPAFPYLEASSARINFKFGQEKTSYVLSDADVALWQDSDNSWGARMRAQPVRTDFNLTDTGQIRIDANWQRATDLADTPLRLTINWQKGQLGQITKLITGKDRGWRGGLDFTANLEGKPDTLSIESDATITDFHRYDILESRNLRLASHCTAHYNVVDAALSDLLCESPVGDGLIRMSGDLSALTSPVTYDLRLDAKKISAASIIAIAQTAKKQLPQDLMGQGSFEASFRGNQKTSGAPEFSGSGKAKDVVLKFNGGKDSLVLNDVPITLVSQACCEASLGKRSPGKNNSAKSGDAESSDPHIRFGPATISVGAAPPVSGGGWISAGGYRFFVRGDIELKNLFKLENALGVPGTQPAAQGSARLDLDVAGAWQGLGPPMANGTAQLNNVRAEVRGLNAPIELASATVTLAPEVATLAQISAHVGATRWTGSVHSARRCAPNCYYQFDLAADQLSSEDIAVWFTPHPPKRPWYRILSSSAQQGPSALLPLRAQGTLRVGQFSIKKATANQVVADLTADHGKISVANLRGQFLQGTYQGAWTIDASVQPPQYRGSGRLQNVSLERVSALMSEDWITGAADGTFDLKASGASLTDIVANTEGNLQFTMRNGSLLHVGIPGTSGRFGEPGSAGRMFTAASGPLPVHRFGGNLRVNSGIWQLSDGKLESRDGFYQVAGTSSHDGALNIIFTRGDEQSWALKGTLAKPHFEAVNTESANRTEAEAKTSTQP